MSKNVLLISVESFKELTSAHTNIDNKLIRPELKAAQDIYIRDLTGSLLYDKLILLIETAQLTVTINTWYKKLLDDYLIDVLINYVLFELPDATTYQFSNKGVAQKTGDNIQSLDRNTLQSIKDKYRNRAEHYAERARKYIMANLPKYPEYSQGGDIDTTRPGAKSFTIPFPLFGGECGCGEIIRDVPGYNSNFPLIT
jgi:hypothetical protein